MASKASIKRLKLTTFKLRALLNITRSINENLTREELLSRYEDILRNDLKIGKLILYKLEEDWKCILSSGIIRKQPDIDVEKDLIQYEEITFLTGIKSKALTNYDIIIPVIHKNKHIAFVIIGDIDEDSEGISPTIKHLNFIQTISNIIIVAIENIRLFKESLKQEAIKKELELASKMQNMLIPNIKSLPKNEGIEVTTFYHPHLEVGGDYYDCISLSDHEIGFCISDVSGKGMSAALLMSNFQANLRALFNNEISLEKLVCKLNDRVMHAANGEKFITLFVARFDSSNKVFEYVNAGHNQPILYSKSNKTLTFLDKGCVGIGMLDEIPVVNKGAFVIEGPTKLLCYTDGLIELLEEDEVSFGTNFIEGEIKNDDPLKVNIDEIIAKQGILKDSANIFDDISILGIEFK